MPIPTDPLLSSQWHLQNNIVGLLDLNVFGVWNPLEGPAYSGAGTRTLVIDDGFDYNHQDFDNYDQSLDYDFEFNTLDPFGSASEGHGTAVAGIIGAAADGSGAVGIAFGTSLVGYRTVQLINDDWLQDVRDAISNAATSAQADVTNISQGIANDADSEFGVGYDAVRFDEIETSIFTAVTTGRSGLGMTIVKSAGNSRSDFYDVNSDDWTNDTRQVVVAAVDQTGFVSSYSSYGAALLVSGFGTPGEVFTTDRTGAAGYDATDFTSSFNGTSSAAPMVTGVVSLMYDANGGLGWRDVQSILAVSARQVGSEVGAGTTGSERYAWEFNGASTWNGGGQHFSNDYGYGLVDALAAVRLAETWLLTGTSAASSGNEFSNSTDVLNVSTVIPDGNSTGLSFTGNASFDDSVERVTVEIAFSTTFTGDMEVYLTSPDGTTSLMIDNAGGGNDFNGTWTFESQAFRGERAAGQWTVRVVDNAGGDVLTVTDIVVRTFGAASSDDRYIYTNEHSDYAGLFGHVTAVNDANGGTDTVNAAAVTSASTINLGGVSTIDGIGGMTFANIENAIGGDGGDTITGDGNANQLFGMRGNDTINGGIDALDDTLVGGFGNDIYIINSASDNIIEVVGEGTADRAKASVSFTLAAGDNIEFMETTNAAGVGAINLTGNELAQAITGNAGANILNGGIDALSDKLVGTLGNDTYIINSATDNIVELFGEGTADRAKASVSFILAAGDNIEFMETTNAAGVGAINLTGNELTQAITGNAGANILNGGIDALSDKLVGTLGNDTYIINSATDNIVELVGEGTADRAKASVSFTLAAGDNIEFMETTNAAGVGAINLTGNELAQAITGNAGANILNGGIDAVSDKLVGTLGNDTYIINSATDNIVELVGEGTADRAKASVSFILAAGDNIEFMETTNAAGVGAINLTGNEIAQTITGNAGANTLNGAGGNDTLAGGAGSDNFLFNTTPNAATNRDTVTDFNIAADTIQLENAIFTGILGAGGGSGTLIAAQFKNLTIGALDLDDKILYNDTSGALFFDIDGSGAAAAIQFATLTGAPTVFFDDFVVV